MINTNKNQSDYGLMVEGLLILSAFFFITIATLFFLNKQVDFSLKDRQINFDYTRAGLYAELPVMVLTADGNPILKTQVKINDLFRTYSEIASRNSIVGYPLCIFLVKSELTGGSIELTRLSNYEYECSTFGSGIPDCIKSAIENLHNVNGKTEQYFIASFYLKDGDLINNKCAVARGTYKDILEPPFTIPTEIPPSITPSPSITIEPTNEPSWEPTFTPSILPSVKPSTEPTVEPSEEPTESPSIEPSIEPTVEPSEEPTESPSIESSTEPTVEPSQEATESPSVEPTTESTVAPTTEPAIESTTVPTSEATLEPTIEKTEEPANEPTEEPVIEVTPNTTEFGEPTISIAQMTTLGSKQSFYLKILIDLKVGSERVFKLKEQLL